MLKVFYFCSLPEMLVQMIKTVKTSETPRWIMVLPLLHLLKGSIKPFEEHLSVNRKYGLAWAGLQGLDIGNPAHMRSQDRK